MGVIWATHTHTSTADICYWTPLDKTPFMNAKIFPSFEYLVTYSMTYFKRIKYREWGWGLG